jgi:hypothetical protein
MILNKIILILTLLIGQTLSAQHQFGVKLGLGTSKSDPNFVNTEYSQFQVNYQASGTAGVYYKYDLNERFYIGADMNFSQIEGQIDAQYFGFFQEIDGEIITVTEVNTANATTNYHLSYLALPIYIGAKTGNFEVALGWQTAFMLRGTSFSDISTLVLGDWVKSTKSSDNLGFDQLDFGLNIGLGFKLNEKWKIHTNFYQGLNDILPSDLIVLGPINPWKNSQFTAGISFKLN